MRESKEYKYAESLDIRKLTDQEYANIKNFRDIIHNNGYVQGYENCFDTHKEYLEWQKPEDVELVDNEFYLVKDQNQQLYLCKFIQDPDWYDNIPILKGFEGTEIIIELTRPNILIKKIEV